MTKGDGFLDRQILSERWGRHGPGDRRLFVAESGVRSDDERRRDRGTPVEATRCHKRKNGARPLWLTGDTANHLSRGQDARGPMRECVAQWPARGGLSIA
jgi:hypothetical protein